MKKIILLFLLSMISISCGNSPEKKSQVEQTRVTENPLETLDGTYLAVFQAVNPKAINKILGSLSITLNVDTFIADIRLSNGNENVVHRQNIHLGTKCPTSEMDVNHDGYIDIVEARPAIDSILMPLDGDLNSQLASADFWPISDLYGGYTWGKTASYSAIIEDLTSPDSNAEDNIVKLPKGEAFRLLGKVVLIQGVSESQSLPSTVATMGRFNKFQTLPIACGIITKVTKFPGIIDYSDEVRGLQIPQGDSVGGSGGAEDGSIFRYGEGKSMPPFSTALQAPHR